MNIFKNKTILLILLGLLITGLSYYFITSPTNGPSQDNFVTKVFPPTYNSELKDDEIINILLVGKDIGKERKANGKANRKAG